MRWYIFLVCGLFYPLTVSAVDPVGVLYGSPALQPTVRMAGQSKLGTAFMQNADDTIERAYTFAWSDGDVVNQPYGTFAECYTEEGPIVGIRLFLTATELTADSLDVYIWSDVEGAPGQILHSQRVYADSISVWPIVSRYDWDIPSVECNQRNYWVGFRPIHNVGIYVAADVNGFGGCPYFNVASGLDYPAGWQDCSLLWGPTQALGIGARFGEYHTYELWGEIKHLYN